MPFSSNMHIIDSNSHNSSHLRFSNTIIQLNFVKRRSDAAAKFVTRFRYSMALHVHSILFRTQEVVDVD